MFGILVSEERFEGMVKAWREGKIEEAWIQSEITCEKGMM